LGVPVEIYAPTVGVELHKPAKNYGGQIFRL
jgi:hypothetical protein